MDMAERLGTVFEEVAKYRDPNKVLRDYWAEKFGVHSNKPEYSIFLASLMANLNDLAKQIEVAEISERNQKLFLGAVQQMQNFCNPLLVANYKVANLKNLEQTIAIYFVISDTIDVRSEGSVQQATLDAIISEILELQKSIANMNADAQLKAFLAMQLDLLLTAIRSYDVIGIEGISKIYGTVASETMRALKPTVLEGKGQIQTKNKVFAALSKFGKAVIWAGGVASGASGLLTSGAEIVETLGIADADDGES